jgi:ABC-2 type transport system ATP-binding protein
MAGEIAIKVKHVSKEFKLPHEKQTSIKSIAINLLKGRKNTYERQQVLNDISFEIKKGEFFGIVGRNGSGKSTLLKMLAGIYYPTSGSIEVHGSLTPFIELGVGFSPELTGRENIFLNGALLGFNRKEMDKMYDDIVSFAELSKFMDQKLKNYSSGMQVRLAFSIAIRADSDLLVLDEVLAVGDAAFQRKCYDYFMSLKKNKRTVVLVTHDMGAVRQYCDRAIMIELGEMIAQGEPDKVAQAYQKLFSDEAKAEDEKNEKADADKNSGVWDRWGDGQVLAQKPSVKITDDKITISTSYVAEHDVPSPIYGFTLYGPNGTNILECNTLKSKIKTKALNKGTTFTIDWELPNIFASGKHSLSVACCDQSTTRFYDWVNDAITFSIRKEDATAGAVDPIVKVLNYK